MDDFFWHPVFLRTDPEFLNLTNVDWFPDLLGWRRWCGFQWRLVAPQDVNQTTISLA